VLVLIGNLSSVSIADLSTELCVAEPVTWNSVCSAWTMFIGGKKIYILCRKDCIGCGRGEIPVKEKKQYKKITCLHDFHSGVLSAHSVSGWDFSLAQPESCISRNGVW